MNLGDRVRVRSVMNGHRIDNFPEGHTFYVTAKGTNVDGLTILYGSEHGAILAVDCELVNAMKCDR